MGKEYSEATYIYHSPCNDGHAAVVAAFLALPDEIQEALRALPPNPRNLLGLPAPDDCIAAGLPVFWGCHPRNIPPECVYKSRDVYLLDLCFNEPGIKQIFSRVTSLTVIDHHDTSVWLNDENMEYSNIHKVIDMTKCGSELAYEYFHKAAPPPRILAYTAAKDLWVWDKRAEHSQEVCLALDVESVYGSLERLVEAFSYGDDRWEALRIQGKACLKFRDMRVANICRHAHRARLPIPPGEFGTDKSSLDIWAVPTSEDVSLVGNSLTSRKFADGSLPDAVAVFLAGFDKTSVSLRAAANSSLKLGRIAKAIPGTLGGGGHDAAAGFVFRGSDIKAYIVPE